MPVFLIIAASEESLCVASEIIPAKIQAQTVGLKAAISGVANTLAQTLQIYPTYLVAVTREDAWLARKDKAAEKGDSFTFVDLKAREAA
jgi:hypothetical protein